MKTNTIIGRSSDYIGFLETLHWFLSSGAEFLRMRFYGIPTFLEWEDPSRNVLLYSTGGPRSISVTPADDFDRPLGQIKIEKHVLKDFVLAIKFIEEAAKVNPFFFDDLYIFAEFFPYFCCSFLTKIIGCS